MNTNLFHNMAQALGQNWALLLTFLIVVAWGSLLVFAYLKKYSADRFADAELVSLALSGWPVPLLLVSLLILALRIILPAGTVLTLALGLMLVTAGLALYGLWGKVKPIGVLPILFFLIFIFIRIGYVAGVVLPSYFDSAEHYRIIQSLLAAPLTWPAPSYYHLGYHVIVAAFTAVTGVDLAQAMLVFGQIIIAALALPMYAFVHRFTGSSRAAFFALMLAAFGWFVPAHAANWGKYPALLGMLAFQFTLGLAMMDRRRLALLSVPFAVLIHSRMAVLLILCLAAWIMPRRARIALALSLGMLGILVWRIQDLGPLWGAYGNWTTLLTGLLAALAVRAFPRLTAVSALALLLGLTATVLPPVFPLLDRPLTEMVLSLPLAFLGGLGAARAPKWITPLLLAAILVHAWTAYSFAPSDCCQLAGRDDIVAMEWLKQNTSDDARILVASADFDLGGQTMRGAGTDAGLWVTPLTGRTAVPFSYFSDFGQDGIHDQLCFENISHIYAGGRKMSFIAAVLQSKPDWYGTVLSLSNTQIFQVYGCPGGG
jgi:hypothetical protein